MRVQLLIAAMALGVCVSLPVKREQRKFIYQDGYPSVRRYPVYPDRLNLVDEELDKMEEMKSGDGKTSTVKPGFTQPKEVNFPDREEPAATDSWLPVEQPDTTTPPRPISTTQASLFEEVSSPLEGASSTLGGGFSFTPKPSSLQNNFVPTGPVTSIVQTDPASPFQPSKDDLDVHNSVFPSGTPEESPVSSSSFGVFTEAPDSTDISLTTDMMDNDFADENLASPTISPLEEKGFDTFADETTNAPFLDQTATEATWDPVTQEIYTTEEIETF